MPGVVLDVAHLASINSSFRRSGRARTIVISLAAGLDARPYRKELPSSLRWIEVDLPELITYKEEVLEKRKAGLRVGTGPPGPGRRGEPPRAVRAPGVRVRKTMIPSEGLLIYLTEAEVASLAWDLAAPPSFQRSRPWSGICLFGRA